MTWGQSKDVFRDLDATDTTRPPGDVSPKVALPIRLMTPDEQANASQDWSIIGGSGIAEVRPACLSNDTRASMEDYWRRRSTIIGAGGDFRDVEQFWSNLFGGRDVSTPRVDAVPIPPGWTCSPWRKDAAAVTPAPGAVLQRYQGWWRFCTPPGAPRAPKPAIKPRPIPVRPPTPQTPRPALPAPSPRVKAMPGVKFQGSSARPKKALPTKKPASPIKQAADKVRAEELEIDRFLEWLEGQEALAVELSMQPPDVRAAILAENPEIVYVWILIGWLELDEAAAQTFATLAGELAEVGLSLFDFEAATRAELPAALAKELLATPLGLADLITPAPMQAAGPVAGQWDAQTGIFLPSEPSQWEPGSETWIAQPPEVEQRASYGYTPQAPRPYPLAGGEGTTAPPWTRAAREERERSGCGIWSRGSRGGPLRGGMRYEFAPAPRETRSGPIYTAAPDPRPGGAGELPAGWSWRACSWNPPAVTVSGCAPCELARIGRGGAGEAVIGGVADAAIDGWKDPACCPHCALENLGPTARAWCAGIASPAARVGDVWGDLARGFAGADRFLSENVWENVKGVVPYGNVIDAAHQVRMRALEAAAPGFYPGRGTSSGASPSSGKAPTKTPARTTAAPAATDAKTDRAITAASRLAAGVSRGDTTATDAVKSMKDHAHAGDPEARRNWRVYVLVARDEHGSS